MVRYRFSWPVATHLVKAVRWIIDNFDGFDDPELWALSFTWGVFAGLFALMITLVFDQSANGQHLYIFKSDGHITIGGWGFIVAAAPLVGMALWVALYVAVHLTVHGLMYAPKGLLRLAKWMPKALLACVPHIEKQVIRADPEYIRKLEEVTGIGHEDLR